MRAQTWVDVGQNAATGTCIAFTRVVHKTIKQQGRKLTSQPNAHTGLGGFSAWPAQARAFSKSSRKSTANRERQRPDSLNEDSVADSIPNQPNAHKGLSALFRLGAPSLGIFKSPSPIASEKFTVRSLSFQSRPIKTKPTECPQRLVHSFPPGSAEPGHFFIAHSSRAAANPRRR
jgi:hypothetical protein